MNRELVNNIESLEKEMENVRNAQKIFSKFTQEQVDRIFKEVAMVANSMRITLAKAAVCETGIAVNTSIGPAITSDTFKLSNFSGTGCYICESKTLLQNEGLDAADERRGKSGSAQCASSAD